MARTRIGVLLLVAAGVVAGACGTGRDEARFLELTKFVQDQDVEVTLNEPLVFHFSEVLDRASVNSGSVRIVAADDPLSPVPGELHVDRKTLSFIPNLPLEPDIDDGSFRPGTIYRVTFAGFPRPDGIRSLDGLPLAWMTERTFRIARDGYAPLFTVGRSSMAVVHLARLKIGPLDPIELRVDGGAVDPRSLRSGEFEMLPRGGDVLTDRVALRPRLVENHASRARILLFPESGRPGSGGLRALEPGFYDLVRARHDLRDLGGQVLRLGAESHSMWRNSVPIEVGRSDASRRISFETTADRSFFEPFGFDATADWSGDEPGVSIRFPAAAGDGHDGAYTSADRLQTLAGRVDVHATELTIPSGTNLDLSSVHGFIVLRSQGPVDIDGTLSRTLSAELPSNMATELETAAFKPESEWAMLSDWLDRSRRLNEPWTVLIAGGELRVRGEIRVDGPLMLIAGGWIRISGHVGAAKVWTSREGGDSGVNVSNAPLVIDAPATNLLRRPLRVAILSNAIRPRNGVERWISALPDIDEGGGTARIRYLGLRDRADGHGFSGEYSPVDDVELLEGCNAVRLLLSLEMPIGDGEPWDPPTIESVLLTWRPRAEASIRE